jgi:hypothetical protein
MSDYQLNEMLEYFEQRIYEKMKMVEEVQQVKNDLSERKMIIEEIIQLMNKDMGNE